MEEQNELEENMNGKVELKSTKYFTQIKESITKKIKDMQASVIISALSVLVAIIAIYISRDAQDIARGIAFDDFILKHRTIIQIKNYAYIDNAKQLIPVPETVMMLVGNNPAKLQSEKYKIKNSSNVIIDEFSYNNGKIIFNNNQSQYTITFGGFREILKNPITTDYFLEIEIKYKSINSSKIYTYESKSKYNSRNLQWDLVFENTD